jgi:hypothetical protein
MSQGAGPELEEEQSSSDAFQEYLHQREADHEDDRAAIGDEASGSDDEPDPAPPEKTILNYEAFKQKYGNKAIESMTRLPVPDFEAECETLEEPLSLALNAKGSGRKSEMDISTQYFIFRSLMASNDTYEKLSRIAFRGKISQSACVRAVHRVVEALHDILQLPASPEDCKTAQKFPGYPKVFCAVDGSNVEVERPKREAKSYWAGKKGWSMKIQASVTAAGRLAHLSPVARGGVHDFKLFKISGLERFLRTGNRDHKGMDLHYWVLGDKGYQGIQKYIKESITPTKKPRGGELGDDDKNENNRQSTARILVENFFGRWKLKFPRMKMVCRDDPEFVGKMMRVSLILTDWDVARHPLRADEALSQAAAEEQSDSSSLARSDSD